MEEGPAAMREHTALSDVPAEPSRFARIKRDLLSSKVHLCTERASLITDYFKRHDFPSDPMVVRKARALRHLLSRKSVRIFADELIVGNVGSKRKSAIIQPELSGVFESRGLLWIDKRKTTPFEISWAEKSKLAFGVLPYWLTRNMAVRALASHPRRLFRYVYEQTRATAYLINEVAGIGHFLPDYPRLIKSGVGGYLWSMKGKEGPLHQAARIACEGVVEFSDRLAREAERMAANEGREERADELDEIARICRKVPRGPADSFHEALQSLWLTHLAVCLEGFNSAISFGRIDQYLYPYYRRDLENGRITPERARELLLCFSAKATEHVFQISELSSKYHGGYLVVQAAIVGGMNRDGSDAVNDLTYLVLDVMEESGLRDPNYQVRIHAGSPEKYVARAAEVARKGQGVPAFFNDEASISALTAQGYPIKEARNYAIVGCVELGLPGRSFLSTDAALFSLPFCLELALNGGRHRGGGRRIGADTPRPASLSSMEMVLEAFEIQVDHMVSRMIEDLQIIEEGNRLYHPTPFSSMLVDGCLESGRDLTEGGARYNSSGIQGVGVADVADSLAALEDVVFKRRKYTVEEVVAACKNDFADAREMEAALRSAAKFGNDEPLPDGYADRVSRMFSASLARYRNTRGGPYVSGFYSSTCHVGFGERVGALPSGRRAGEPFAASLGPANGSDRRGPTAMLNSAACVDPKIAPNGYAVNLRFDPHTLAGDRGINLLTSLVKGFFKSGGMELQLNVLDPEMLEDARSNPGKHPELVVRVAGYCACFDDLPDAVKLEIIARTRQTLDASGPG